MFKLNFKTTTDAIPYVLDNLTSKEPLLILFIILSITLLYRLFLQPLVSLYSIFLKKEIKVKIKLSNNETIHNAYLLYPTFGNRLLLGNKPLSSSSDHKFAISRDKIEYIEFFIRDVFSRDTHYNKDQISFGKKDTPKVFISNHKNYRKIKRKR
ncbi:hypothetical protein [Robertmurraya sp.]|uniref:hypothetical protein n=1 Tax=Robertmurraya sp. TaxID=2837525 RepID=UPI003704D37F